MERRILHGRLWVAMLGVLVVAAAGIWSVGRWQNGLGTKIVLHDGTELTLQAVTFGREHSQRRGSLIGLALERLPARWTPNWDWIQRREAGTESAYARFAEPHLVLWFLSRKHPNLIANSGNTPAPRQPSNPEMLHWKIAGPDGVEHGGMLSHSPDASASGKLFALFIDSYPRRLSRFTVRLSDADGALIGTVRVRNTEASRARSWRPDPIPAFREDAGVRSTLTNFAVVKGNGGQLGDALPAGSQPTTELVQSVIRENGGWSGASQSGDSFRFRDETQIARATFEIADRTDPSARWELWQFRLSDPTGNSSRARAASLMPLGNGLLQLQCDTVALWPDDPGWKIQLDLVRTDQTRSNRVLHLNTIPLPSRQTGDRLVLQTNVLGRTLTVRSLVMTGPRPNAPFIPHRMAGVQLELGKDPRPDTQTPEPVMRVLAAADEGGRPLAGVTLEPEPLAGAGKWRLNLGDQSRPANSGGTSSVDLIIAFPEQRHFKFIVPSQRARK